MNSMQRLLELHAVRQLANLRPSARRALMQFERGQSPLQPSFQTRAIRSSIRNDTRRTMHTQRSPLSSSSSRRVGSGIAQNIRRTPRSSSSGTQHQRGTRWSSSSSSSGKSTERLSFSQRMKKLSREYGWAALGVYLALTALDFPFCFLAVRMLGTDRIGHWEHVALSWIKGVVSWPLPQRQKEVIDAAGDVAEAAVAGEAGGQKRLLEEEEEEEEGAPSQQNEVEDHGYKEAEKANAGSNASIWTQLALAYAIHKSFIFVRVPLTAAVTPKVVKTLRGWGWNIGKMPKKGVSGGSSSGTAGVNTKGSKVKSDD
ncbi:hypothetical protein PV08_08413 [Exophiala spinifera]|uniref:DUF1279 domain-containing protein n=1 Tax=Exophiala spinifera TaxID=91928 RepID=A0A0D1YDT8_9EURO|nr:uncharacterized protein PV08_08413 [Exophiala spinifera]KIW13226.1 hypothetical protein PV08_08413 [Exophiala spinifera]